MRGHRIVRVVVWLFLTPCAAPAQGTFQNLDFEAATISPTQPPGFVSSTVGLPGWAVYLGANQQTQIGFNNPALGSTWVSLIGTNNPYGLSSIEGNFSVLLQAGADPIHISPQLPVFLGQTGLVPSTAHSIRFKAVPQDGTLGISLSGAAIPYFYVSSGPGYSEYAGDISAYAGTLAQLEISLQPSYGPGYNMWYLDSIEFSNLTVPEPTTAALLLASGSFLLRFRRESLRRCGS